MHHILHHPVTLCIYFSNPMAALPPAPEAFPVSPLGKCALITWHIAFLFSNASSLFALTVTRISPKMLHSWQISHEVNGLSQVDLVLQHPNHSLSFYLKTHSPEYQQNLLLGSTHSNSLKNLALSSPSLFPRVSPIIIIGELNTMAAYPFISFPWVFSST